MKFAMPGENVDFPRCPESIVYQSERLSCSREEEHEGWCVGVFESALGPHLVTWTEERLMSISFRAMALNRLKEMEGLRR